MLFSVLVFLLVLGVLIFIHELGHFLAAKACGVYCDQFSLGMPPRVIGFRIGETDYCLGLLPIGGYVKMAGQEDAPTTEEERRETYGHVPEERWYNNKPTWQRAIILAAGPLMNLVLGIFLYGFVAGMGAEVPQSMIESRVGFIEETSPALTAPLFAMAPNGEAPDLSGSPDAVGWQTGDRIVAIDGTAMRNFSEVGMAAALGEGSVLKVELERETPGGVTQRYLSPLEPQIIDGSEHTRFGVQVYDAALIRYTFGGYPAEAGGLLPGDEIVAANGRPTDKTSFGEMLLAQEGIAPVEVQIQRDGVLVPLTITPKMSGRLVDLAVSPPLHPLSYLAEDETPRVIYDDSTFLAKQGLKPGQYIRMVAGITATGRSLRALETMPYEGDAEVVVTAGAEDDSTTGTKVKLTWASLLQAVTAHDENDAPVVLYAGDRLKEEVGIQRKDVIASIDGEPATAALLRQLQMAKAGQQLELKIERPAILFGLLQKASTEQVTLPIEQTPTIGVVWDTKMVIDKVPLGRIVPEAFSRGWGATTQIVAILHKLSTGVLKPNELGGPLLIAQISSSAARMGLSRLLEVMAFISINLCVFNLLPLPVLDGGQLVLVGLEAVRRKPISFKLQMAIQQVGVVFILFLIVFVTYNDVLRWGRNLLP